MDIVIWDNDAARINEISRNLLLAMRQLGLEGKVSSMSEPPLIGREGLLGKTPVLEIGGYYWSLRAGESVSLQECLNLFRRLGFMEEDDSKKI